jgi:hypothetical protein
LLRQQAIEDGDRRTGSELTTGVQSWPRFKPRAGASALLNAVSSDGRLVAALVDLT